MLRKNSFIVFFILIFLNITVSLSSDNIIKNIEIKGNKRIPTSFILNVAKKYLNLNISSASVLQLTKLLVG